MHCTEQSANCSRNASEKAKNPHPYPTLSFKHTHFYLPHLRLICTCYPATNCVCMYVCIASIYCCCGSSLSYRYSLHISSWLWELLPHSFPAPTSLRQTREKAQPSYVPQEKTSCHHSSATIAAKKTGTAATMVSTY